MNTILLLLTFNILCGSGDTSFSITGEFEENYTGKVFLVYANKSGGVIDSTAVENGRFKLQGEITEPTKADFFTGEALTKPLGIRSVFLEPGNLKIKTKNKFLLGLTVTGSLTQTEYEKLYQPLDSLKYLSDSLEHLKSNHHADSIRKCYYLSSKRIDSGYVISSSNSWISAYILYQNIVRYKTINFYPADRYYQQFSPDIKNSFIGERIKYVLDADARIKMGKKMPSFQYEDINKKFGYFNDGNLYLIYFWGSWCRPCKEVVPYLEKYKRLFVPKGLKILCIATNDNIDNLKKAVKEEGKDTFINILDHNNYLSRLFYLDGVPSLYLVDKNNILLGKYSVGSQYGYETLDDLTRHINNALHSSSLHGIRYP